MRASQKRAAMPALALLAVTLLVVPGALAVLGDITLASTSDLGSKGHRNSFWASLSADGTKVGFATSVPLDPADTDLVTDVYVKDLSTGDITLASTSDTGTKGNDFSAGASLSADGTKVAFTSFASNLDPADPARFGADVYVKDLLTGDLTLASTSDTGEHATGESDFGASLSADGTKVAFTTPATNLDPADTDGLSDVYVKDLSTGDITLASTSDNGTKGNDTSIGVAASLSADGTKVAFFSSATNLDPADTDGLSDVYVKDLSTGDITLASTSDNGIHSNGSSLRASLSADGAKVAFESYANNLDPADRDTFADIYVKDLVAAPPMGDCTITGTEGDDVLNGTPGDDVICGLGGDDTLRGGFGGDDLIVGGDGNDDLRGGSGADTLRGERGNDILRASDGVSGNDTADGGDGVDRCRSDPGDIVIDCP